MGKIFEEKSRIDVSRAQHAESIFSFLDRSAWQSSNQVRDMLEDWFSRYPACEQNGLRGRIRSSDSEYKPAVFELLLHEVLIRLGCTVEVHPILPSSSKRPDFLVHDRNGSQFYLEAALVTDSTPKTVGDQARMDRVQDIIESIDSPNFWISVEAADLPSSDIPKAPLIHKLKTWLATLNYSETHRLVEQHGLEAAPRLPWQGEAWDATFIATARSSPNQTNARTLGIIDVGGFKCISPAKAIQSKIEEKAGRYGDLPLPFLIAINCQGLFVGATDIEDALYGPLSIVSWLDGTGNWQSGERRGIGAWVSPNDPQYTRVSGVLIGKRLDPWSMANATLTLYQNPWAKRPYQGPLLSLPQAVVRNKKLEFQPGISLKDLFGLSEDWPGLAGKLPSEQIV